MIFSSNKYERFNLQDTFLRKNGARDKAETEPSEMGRSEPREVSTSLKAFKKGLQSPTNFYATKKSAVKQNSMHVYATLGEFKISPKIKTESSIGIWPK